MRDNSSFVSGKIGDGIYFHALKSNKFKSGYLSVNIITPLSSKTASLSSLLTDVLTAGCEKYPSLSEISKREAELYSAVINSYVGKRGEKLVVTFDLSLIDNKYAYDSNDLFKDGMELLSEIMFRPLLKNGVFDETIVEREKVNLCDSIREQDNSKGKYAMSRCTQIMCEGEPFAVDANGTIADVEAIDSASLYNHYLHIMNDYVIEIFYVGRMERETVAEYIKSTLPFADTKRIMKFDTVVKSTAESLRDVTEIKDVVQGKLIMGFRTGILSCDDDFIALKMFNEIFGASPSSKLFMNVREKLSLCYYCRPIPVAMKGVLFISSGIDPANKDKAVEAILKELQAMKDGDISETELDNGKRSLANAHNSVPDSAGGMVEWGLSQRIASMYLGETSVDKAICSPESVSEKLYDITIEQISAVAKKLVPDTYYLLKGN